MAELTEAKIEELRGLLAQANDAATRMAQNKSSLTDLMTIRSIINAVPALLDLAASSLARGGEGLDGAFNLIQTERLRQIEVEGWTPEHDDTHADGEMLAAAIIYLWWGTDKTASIDPATGVPFGFPWDKKWWKPKHRFANVMRAGALCMAETARRRRLGLHPEPSDHKLRICIRELAALMGARGDEEESTTDQSKGVDENEAPTVGTHATSPGRECEPAGASEEELCKRLLAEEPCDIGPFLDDDTGPFERQRGTRLVNPDGLKAASLIRRLVQERDEARIELGNAGEDYREQEAKLRNTFFDAQSMKARAITAEAEAERLRAENVSLQESAFRAEHRELVNSANWHKAAEDAKNGKWANLLCRLEGMTAEERHTKVILSMDKQREIRRARTALEGKTDER